MKADPAVQQRLLELADTDAQLARVAHRRKTLPELAEIEQVEKELRASKDALVGAQTSGSDLDREVKRQEREVESVRAREDRDRALMASGSVGAKQLTDLEHELQTLVRRQTALEDDLLELMEQREALGEHERRMTDDVAAAEQRLAELAQRRDAAYTELAAEEQTATAARTGLVDGIPDQVLTTYDRVRANRGRGAGLLRARRCGACQLEIDSSAIGDIRHAAADEVITCDNCGAILVRTAESGL